MFTLTQLKHKGWIQINSIKQSKWHINLFTYISPKNGSKNTRTHNILAS